MMVQVAKLSGAGRGARPTRRSGGRAERIKLREAKSAAKAVGPGLKGGSYKPLSERDIARIHGTVLDVLENIGIGDPLPEIVDAATAKGCWLDERHRLCFPRAFVEDVIAGACRGFTIHGRDPAYDVDLGGDKVHYATAGEAVTVYQPETRSYRPSTLLDLYDMARLVDRLDNIHRFCQTVIATELEDPRVHALNVAYAMVAGTQKSLAVSILGPDDIAAVVAMLDLIAGGEGTFKKRPFCTIGCCPILSPLRFGEDACHAAIATLRLGVPCDFAVAPQAGATAPAALAGSLVQVTAETLATVILTNLFAPGHPTTYAAWPFVSDLRTGAFTGGSGEEALLSAAAVQIGNFYDLPTTVGAGMTDSKLPDNQAGFEKALTTALTGLAGANYVGECAGMQASLMGCSFEALAIDNDMLGAVERTVRGVEVTDETLSYEVIKDVAYGAGHFLGTEQTLALMESEYYYPELADRRAYGEWQQSGSPDIRDLAEQRVRDILSAHYPAYIDPKLDEEIRNRFPIVLPREAMQPACGRW
jgi:trimethylamine--corrinoid protein Co-methyltransferase